MDAPDAGNAGKIHAQTGSRLRGQGAVSADADSAEADSMHTFDFVDNIERHGAPNRRNCSGTMQAAGVQAACMA